MNETEHNKTLSRCGVSANNLVALTALALSLGLLACGGPPAAPQNATPIALPKPSLADVCAQSGFQRGFHFSGTCHSECKGLEWFVGNRDVEEFDTCFLSMYCMDRAFNNEVYKLHVSEYAPVANECVESMYALFSSIDKGVEVSSAEETCVNNLLKPDTKDATEGIRPSEDDGQYANRKKAGTSRLATWKDVLEGRANLTAVRDFLSDARLLGVDYDRPWGKKDVPFQPACRIAFARGMSKSIAAWKRPVEERRAKEQAKQAEWESGRVQRERDAVLGRRFVPIEKACAEEGTLAAARCEQLEGLAPEEVTKCRNACDRAIEQQAGRLRVLEYQSEAEARSAVYEALCAHERYKRKREDEVEVETATYGQEKRLLDEVATLFERETTRLSLDAGVVERASRFIAAMAGPNAFADVLSLNVDPLLDVARPERQNVRVWYPHGRADDAKNRPVFGTFRYGKSITAISASFVAFKRSEGGTHATRAKAKTVHEANAHRAEAIPDDVGWVGAAINAPLLLLGVGFDRSEIDLWHFLQLRARNHARVPSESRPRIFRLTCDQEQPMERDHWKAVSDGLSIQPLHLGATWSEAWNALLPMLAKEDAFTP